MVADCARNRILSTTVVAVRDSCGAVVVGADGQVTFGDTILKGSACKVRTMYDGRVLAGFAGASADAFTLFEHFERELEAARGQLPRAAVELAKKWRMDKYLGRLEAMLVAADAEHILVMSGEGDVVEPDEPYTAVGAGGAYALAALKTAFRLQPGIDAAAAARLALEVAAGICIYTNDEFSFVAIERGLSDGGGTS